MISLIRFFYNLLFPVVLVILLPGFLLRMIRRGKYRHKFWQRFGIYSPGVRQKISDGRVWVHAVSVGEVIIALKLIRLMRARDPEVRFVLSTTTSTGFKLSARAKCPWLEPIYNPLDFYLSARAAVRTIRPRQLILVEAEAWPNILAETRALGTKIAMVNTRLSTRSERRFRAFKLLATPVFNQIDLFCLQETADIARWKELGVEPQKLVVTGSIKFDDEAVDSRPHRDFQPLLRRLGIAENAPVLLGGSTFEGEEVLLAETLQALRKTIPGLFLIVVPRHFERSPGVARDLAALGLRVARRTQATHPEKPDALIVDTTGELREWYACATVVFIGKSFFAKGGQNPAEPIAAGVPVVFGPHMKNFASLSKQLLREKGAFEIRSREDFVFTVNKLLGDPSLRAETSFNASNSLAFHRGATVRTCEKLDDLILPISR